MGRHLLWGLFPREGAGFFRVQTSFWRVAAFCQAGPESGEEGRGQTVRRDAEGRRRRRKRRRRWRRKRGEEKCALALPCSGRRHPAISHQEEKINLVGDKASFCDCLKMNY